MATVEGEIWLTDDGANRVLLEQLGLLRAIAEAGSISAAARNLGISYKTAWDRLERLNNLSKLPLVLRTSGGSKGGGSQLTDYGRQLLAGFEE
ncbi:MAG: LysR family transcriptional regulator, partial [Proteobacteria bacterium]|nr:LysR family transcriptional regulator [Pseudomonadota bacterium]